jgi:hypothetical protein
MSTFITLLVVVGGSVCCGWLASKRGRSVGGWAVLGFFFPVISLLILAAMGSKKPAIASASRPLSGGALPKASAGMGGLSARVQWTKSSGDIDVPHNRIELKGRHNLPAGETVVLRNFLLDITNPEDPAPIIALLDFQQANDSVAFLDVTDFGYTERGQYLNMATWTDVGLRMFPEMLKSTYSGKRRLRAQLSLISGSGQEFWTADVDFDVELPVPGYIEDHDRELADDGLIIRLGVAMAASSGGVTDDELTVLRDWSQARLAYLDKSDTERGERAAALNSALERSVHDAEADTLDLGATIGRFLAEGSESGKIEAVELALAVMRADGAADSAEMALVNKLASKLGVDEKWYAENRDKSISGLVTQSESATDFALLLGIDITADQETIRVQLNEQYDRWNSRSISLSDPAKRREAEEMLNTIALARAELLST